MWTNIQTTCRHPIFYLSKFGIPGLDDDTILSITMKFRTMNPKRRFGKAHKLKTKAQKPKPKPRRAYASFKWRMHLRRCICHSNMLHLRLSASKWRTLQSRQRTHLWDISHISLVFPYESQPAMWGVDRGQLGFENFIHAYLYLPFPLYTHPHFTISRIRKFLLKS
jgi:hypothetical protein